MRYIDIILLSLRIFRVHRLRTLLTIFAVAVGVAVIVFLVALGYGLQQVTVEKIAKIEAFLALDVTTARADILPLDQSALAKFSKIDQVAQVSPLISYSSQIIFGDKRADVGLSGAEGTFFSLDGLNFFLGSGYSANDRAKIVVSRATLKLLGLTAEEAIGQELELLIFLNRQSSASPKKAPEKYTIVGVLADDSIAQAFINLSDLRALTETAPQFDLVKVKVTDRSQIESVKAIIAALGYSASSVVETINEVNRVFRYLRLILGGLGLIALFVAAIGMFNTMTISLLERIREIGVMRALGASDRDIWSLFLTEAWIVGMSGAVIGVACGVGFSKVANSVFNIFAQTLGGEPQTVFDFPLLFVISMIIFAQLVAIGTGIYPAYRAVKVNPLDALRYE